MVKRNRICVLIFCFCYSFLFPFSDHPVEPRQYVDYSPALPMSSYMHMINISLYRQKFERSLPDWIRDTMESEFAYFKEHPITQSALDATYQKILSHGYPQTHYVRRYRIIGQKIYATGILDERETDPILRTLARLSDYPGIPDLPNVDFMVNHNDGMPMSYDPPGFWITENPEDQAPVLSGGKRADAPYVIVIPHRHPMPTWNELFRVTFAHRSPWKDKIKSACWRGNIYVTEKQVADLNPDVIEMCMQEPRVLLSLLSQEYPDYIDAGFSTDLNWLPSEELKKRILPLVKGPLSPPDHIRYAYLPILDGAMISGAGYEWRLLSNSLVFKPDSPNVAWHEKGVKPYVHFIPIHNNFDDLIEKIEWARAHDRECEEMANKGGAFALEHLTIEGLYYFIFQILQAYEKCQAFNTLDLLSECERDPKWTRIR